MSGYVFRDADLIDRQRAAMQECLDPITLGHLAELDVRPGLHCLDVGAGGGSVATWLAGRVGPTGSVLATDVDYDAVRHDGPLEYRPHDVVTDPLPENRFDLVHARLVLIHLADRIEVLGRMVRALRPDGRLLLGEFDCTWMPVLSVPRQDDADLFRRFHRGLCTLLRRAGADVEWGTHAYRAVLDQGLGDVDYRAVTRPWRGGGSGCRWLGVNARQLAGPLVGTGLLTAPDLDRLHLLFGDPEFAVSSYLVVTVSGTRR